LSRIIILNKKRVHRSCDAPFNFKYFSNYRAKLPFLILSQTDLENGAQINELVNPGEFFGVKSALAHKPKMETANVVSDVQVIQLSVQEFEQIIGRNQEMILKMLRVFSKNLRQIHKKTENVMKNDTASLPPELGMNIVSKCFFDEQKYYSCVSVCNKFLGRFPGASNANVMKKLHDQAELLYQRQGAGRGASASYSSNTELSSAGTRYLIKFVSLLNSGISLQSFLIIVICLSSITLTSFEFKNNAIRTVLPKRSKAL